jgi:hypothetical protein
VSAGVEARRRFRHHRGPGRRYQDVTYAQTASGADTLALDDHVSRSTASRRHARRQVASLTERDRRRRRRRLRDDAVPADAARRVTGTFGLFANPTASLTINLGTGDDLITIETFDSGFSAAFDVRGGDGRDRIDFVGTVATRGHDLNAAAETIAVAAGSVLRTDLGADGAVGDMGLAAGGAPTRSVPPTLR